MLLETSFLIALIAATFLCSLVAGIVLCFSLIVMPGTGTLDDRSFLQSFKVMDKIIQDNHPVFMLVWVGSIFAVLSVLVIGTYHLTGSNFYLLLAASLLYLLGVQLPTVRFNIPLNNELQKYDLDSLNMEEVSDIRTKFEASWNRWNRFRTIISVISVLFFLILMYRF